MNNPVLTWVTSSYSSQGNCVEIAVHDHVLVRDTKNRTGPVLRFAPEAWRQFAEQVKRTLAAGLRPESADACGGHSRVRECPPQRFQGTTPSTRPGLHLRAHGIGGNRRSAFAVSTVRPAQ